jgi:glycosyltransferase involved in cell wall biosynthesis
MSVHWTERIVAELEERNTWYRRASELPATVPPTGINLCGYLRDESGWGAAGRGYARALERSGLPTALLDLSDLSSNRSGDTSLGAGDVDYPHPINLVCVDPSQHYAFLQRCGEDFLRDRYTIGAWAWELPRFPARWYDRFAYYDEIWVTTSFVANVLAPISPVPVVRIPPPLTAACPGSRPAGRRRLGVGDEFVFLFVFDVHSHLERKNPLAVVEAFRAAFRPSDPVRLVIKSVNGRDDPSGMRQLEEAARGYPVSLHDGYWSPDEVRDLMAACDAYVSLHRSEGTGLTITDAMALGKAVIATGWSGTMDFMTVANSYPVRYELTQLSRTVGPYAAGETWADPSIEHAASLMRHVVDHPDEARALGAAAHADLEREYSPAAVGNLIRERLLTIAHRDARQNVRSELERYFAGYRSLTADMREIVEAVTSPHSTVLLVSKGDEDLVRLHDRTGWHFPRTEDGIYAGYHPADSEAAIAHLEELRGHGAQVIVFPGTAFWWFDHYAAFRRHLDGRYRRIWADERCVIYDLLAADHRPDTLPATMDGAR